MIEAFWRFLAATYVRAANVRQPHRLPTSSDRTQAMPIGERYAGMRDCRAIVGRDVPASERMGWLQLAVRAIAITLRQWIPLGPSLPKPDPDDTSSHPRQFESLYAQPWRPESFDAGRDLLADLATRGPFSFYTLRRDDGDFEIDVTSLEGLTPQTGFLPAGGRAVFALEGGALRTRYVEGWGERQSPGSTGFALAQSRFLAGLGTYMTVVDHVLRAHLATCGTVAVASLTHLPATHPLRILLQPTIIETIRVNNYQVGALVGADWSAVPAYSQFPIEAVHTMLREHAARFELRRMDPLLESRRRGVEGLRGMVTVESAIELRRIFGDYAAVYCAHYLASIDAPVRAWAACLDETIPNGIRDYLGIASLDLLTPAHVAQLVSLHAYTASVWHYVVGDLTRNYYLFPHRFPSAVPTGGGPPPRGLAQEKTNSIAVAGIHRYWLIDPTVPVPDEAGRALRDHFFDDLRAYRAREVARDPDLRYRVDPELLMSSIHA